MKFFLKGKWILFFSLYILTFSYGDLEAQNTSVTTLYHEFYRPQYHFSPPKHWTNDPNGMVYYDGEYHLFYQYYPDSTVWGPMHWGHAVSTDLFHWKNLPIALYPDSLGYIFSGSAIVDKNNTSNFGKNGQPPLVAIFTQHNPKTSVQVQSIAYSLDKGRTWTKYKDNPVIPNPGLQNFRDPKVRWSDEANKWIMTLACGDHVQFYSSPDLKHWQKESDFGKDMGAHGGVWECPDLFPLKINNKKKWVLIVNINPGGPAGGSATQYFIGQFNGHRFTPDDSITRWEDYGADEYAGVTWSNIRGRTIFLGWMNNWQYADKIPTSTWRGSMTLPRKLGLSYVNDTLRLTAQPVKEVKRLEKSIFLLKNKKLDNLRKSFGDDELANAEIDISAELSSANGMILSLENDKGEHVNIVYNKVHGQIYINRSAAGRDDFSNQFKPRQLINTGKLTGDLQLKIFYDRSSLEVFVNNGHWVLTDREFPHAYYNKISIHFKGAKGMIKSLDVKHVHSVWQD